MFMLLSSSVNVEKCTLLYILHYKAIQNNLTTLKIPLWFSNLPSRPPAKPLAITNVLIIFIVLPFMECHINKIV